jgi:hypothetical protein
MYVTLESTETVTGARVFAETDRYACTVIEGLEAVIGAMFP